MVEDEGVMASMDGRAIDAAMRRERREAFDRAEAFSHDVKDTTPTWFRLVVEHGGGIEQSFSFVLPANKIAALVSILVLGSL